MGFYTILLLFNIYMGSFDYLFSSEFSFRQNRSRADSSRTRGKVMTFEGYKQRCYFRRTNRSTTRPRKYAGWRGGR
jgi:hypothetical protein